MTKIQIALILGVVILVGSAVAQVAGDGTFNQNGYPYHPPPGYQQQGVLDVVAEDSHMTANYLIVEVAFQIKGGAADGEIVGDLVVQNDKVGIYQVFLGHLKKNSHENWNTIRVQVSTDHFDRGRNRAKFIVYSRRSDIQLMGYGIKRQIN